MYVARDQPRMYYAKDGGEEKLLVFVYHGGTFKFMPALSD